MQCIATVKGVDRIKFENFEKVMPSSLLYANQMFSCNELKLKLFIRCLLQFNNLHFVLKIKYEISLQSRNSFLHQYLFVLECISFSFP